MSGKIPKAANPESSVDEYEATILDFLDREISASAESLADKNPQGDEVEAMVSDLIKQTTPADTNEGDEFQSADLDVLLSDILNACVESSQAKSHIAPTEIDRKPETGQAIRVSARLSSLEHETGRKAAILPGEVIPSSHSEGVAAPVIEHGSLYPESRPIPNKGPTRAARHAQSVSDRAPLIGLVPNRLRGSGRAFIIGAALLSLLLAIGISVRNYAGHKIGTSGKIVQTVSSTAPSSYWANNVAAPPATPQGLGTGEAKSATRPPGPTPSAPSALEVGKGHKKPALTPDADDEETLSPTSTPPADTATPATSVDKPAAGVTVADNSKTYPKPQIAENPEPPATVIALQPPASSIPGKPVLAASPNLEAIRPDSTSPVLPSTTTRMKPAVLLSQALPKYPEIARRMHLTGTVHLDVEIDKEGKVVRATVVDGPPLLRSAAVDAVLRWRYKPASVGETAIRSQGQISIIFNNP